MNWIRFTLLSSCCALALSQIACTGVSRRHLRMSQHRAMRLYAENQELMNENSTLAMQSFESQQSMQALAQQNAQLEQQLAHTHNHLNIANERLANLQHERGELHDRYKNLLIRSRSGHSPLSEEATRRFQELARKYPNFEFDPITGVSKFHADVLFSSGSANLRESARPMLHDLAEIMNHGSARSLNMLVVGHTDDQPISNASVNHPTNWHLSTNRANSVLMALEECGVADHRMGAAGYGETQPLVANTSQQARQRNRRVEIFVLSPDAVVAGWDPRHKH
ncbi:MAG: OmpA family protein [Planctomycetaceae bacterium]|nr:OmpA family protein [Planctomycetaceae bacterium]